MDAAALFAGWLEKAKKAAPGAMESAVQAMDEAIRMHQTHLKDPKTATPESQQAMMAVMMRAMQMMRQHMSEMAGQSAMPMMAGKGA